jgi:DNA-binding transcriptional regulator YiaG
MNIATVLKGEISRVARKELRAEAAPLKRSSAQYRSDIASLKKRVTELERLIRRLSMDPAKSRSSSAQVPEENPSIQRFSAKGMAAQRKRLGLSAAELGLLLGVSAQSVYHWEQGKSRPRAAQMSAISAVRKMSRRDAAYRLSVLQV